MLSGRSDIDLDQFFRSFDFSSRKAVIAAVSGGSDSLAMLLLLQCWLERHAPATRLVAVTVDHRLRPEARGEAEAVATLCAARDIAHRALAWTEAKPDAGLAAAGRLARYRLLADAAREAGGDLIVTGHTADDQAETVAMRQERGDGRGLAGMAPATLFEGRAWILRPLLRTGREELRGFLRGEGAAWIDDPSNINMKYERPRIRIELSAERARHAELLSAADTAASRRIQTSKRAAQVVKQHVARPLPGLLKLGPGFFDSGGEASVFALRVLLAVTGGVTQLADAERAADLFGRLASSRLRATLARTVVDRRKDATFLYRERRRLPPPMRVEDGIVWDGRYRLVAARGNVIVAPVGAHPGRAAGLRPDEIPASLEKAALFAEPRFSGDDGSPLDPRAVSATPVPAPWRQFLPSFDIAIAHAVSELLGAAKIPPPPWVGHNGEEA